MKCVAIIVALVMATSALAQQPTSLRSIDIQTVRDQLGDGAVALAFCKSDAKNVAENDQRTIAALQKENADLQKQLEEAKAAKENK